LPENKEDAGNKLFFHSPKGMHDILPPMQDYWQYIEQVFREEAEGYGFRRIDTPILEQTELFSRGIGQGTDIVEKEMFSFKTKGGSSLTLRPEATAPIARAFIENGMFNLPNPVKLYTSGPFFRHERPQKSRFRQFHQLDLEILGSADPASDAEIVLVLNNIFKRLKIRNLVFQVSSLGDRECRFSYEDKLRDFLKENKAKLCRDCRRSIDTRPLRVFDCKEEKCQRLARNAPKMIDNLCKACHKHLESVLEILDDLEIPYQLNDRIVRGLDYYTRTVFEVWNTNDSDSSAPIALGGGGRYDYLIESLGGKPTPAVGVALGVERIIELMRLQKIKLPSRKLPRVFLAHLTFDAKKRCFKLFEDLRKNKIPVSVYFDRNTLRSQLRIADRLGVDYTLILGQKEFLEGTIILRDMKTGNQETIEQKKIISELKARLKKTTLKRR